MGIAEAVPGGIEWQASAEPTKTAEPGSEEDDDEDSEDDEAD